MSIGGSSQKSSSSTARDAFDIGQQFSMGGSYLDPTQQAGQNWLTQSFQNRNMLDAGTGQGFQQYRQASGNLLNQAQQGVSGYLPGFAQAAQYGQQQLSRFATQGNPYLQNAIGALGQDFGQFYREQLLPGIGSQYALAGQRGGSRQGIAEGLAAQRVAQEFGQQAAGMRLGAYGQQQQASQALAGLGQSGLYAGYGALGDLAGTQQGTMAGYQGMNFLPFQIGSGVIGAPSVLNYNMGGGYNLGMDRTRSTSKGSGASMQLGFT